MLYVLFSYYQITQNIKSHNQTLLLQEQKEVAEAFHHFQQFLSLTESRLLNSLNKPKAIPAILAGKIEQLVGGRFPEIESLTFIPTADLSSNYTRLGKNLLTKDKATTESTGITSLGDGTFKLIKTLYDGDKKGFGILQSTFSLASLLYRNFSEGEIDIIQDKEKPLNKEYSSFKIPDLPYIFVLKREPSSFLQFLWDPILLSF